MSSLTPHPIFTRDTANAVLKPKTLERMKWSLLGKDKATIGEIIALEDAIAFARKWTSGNPAQFFTFEESAKHINAVLNIAEKHFPAN